MPGLCELALTLALSTACLQPDDPPWLRMDYGPFISTALSVDDATPVHKGIIIQLRTPDGEATDIYAVFDTDLLAWRCVWQGDVALRGIVYDGPHGVHPEIDGEPLIRLPAQPGMMRSGKADDPRDDPWGPVPPSWGRWSGLHLDGDDVIIEYTIADGRHQIRERIWAQPRDADIQVVREIDVSTSGRHDGPIVALADQLGRNQISIDGDARTLRRHARTWLRLPSDGLVRVTLAPSGPAAAPRARSLTIDDAIARARPRWGAPLDTEGVIEANLDGVGQSEQILHHATDIDQSHTLAQGPNLTLLANGHPATSAPAQHSIILNTVGADNDFTVADARPIGWWRANAGAGTHERNDVTGTQDLRLEQVTWRQSMESQALDFNGEAAAWLDEVDIDLREDDLTVAAWISTAGDGTIFAIAPQTGDWAPGGFTLFVRNGRLCADVGWVGVITGQPRIDDGAWHHVAVTWRDAGTDVRLFVDGHPVASGPLPLEDHAPEGFVARFGWTNHNFPSTSRFTGAMDGLLLLRTSVQDDAVSSIARATGEPLVEATLVRAAADTPATVTIDDDTARLNIPAGAPDAVYRIESSRGPRSTVLEWANRQLTAEPQDPFRIDRLTWPDENPHASWMRFGAFHFLSPDSAVITTWSGDVWRVDGLDETLELTWTRMATGLNQPFGVLVDDDDILVLGRDQITRLVDHNADGEADAYVNVNNQAFNSEHFHEPASGLTPAPDGGLLYHKAARHAKLALHDHHGTVIYVSPDRQTTRVVARGFRAPVGLLRLPDGTLMGSDQQGHWTPANRINLIRPATDHQPALFYGNGWAAHPHPFNRVTRDGEQTHPTWRKDIEMQQPLCWIHPSVDRSPSSQVYVDHPAWGPLNGHVLGLSYGTGEVYLILRDDVPADSDVIAQGGIVKLGIKLPTGLLDGQIHPETGDLYVCGLFGWSSDQTDPGGFYRIRPRTDTWAHTLNVPVEFRARPDGLDLTFLHPLDPESATSPDQWNVQAWNYNRSANYGSPTYDLEGALGARTTWALDSASLSADGRTVSLTISEFEPAMQVHVRYDLLDATHRPIAGEAHLTIHAVHTDQR